MAEPIETVIIRWLQKFEIENGLNPVEIEINNDRILNIFKKQKKCKRNSNYTWTAKIWNWKWFKSCRNWN